MFGPVATPGLSIQVTPTVTAAGYSSGNAVGGKQTLVNACRVASGQCILQSLVVVDKGNQGAALSVIFFNDDPTAATITDKTAFVFSTDITKVVGIVNVTTYASINSKATATLYGIGLQMQAVTQSSLFVAVVTTGSPTYATTTDLIFNYGFLQF